MSLAHAADEVSPGLVPTTYFTLQPGSNDHSLLLLLTAQQCYHEFAVGGLAACLR